jgi:hypothetical protein
MTERIIEKVDPKAVIKKNAEASYDWEWHEPYMLVSNISERFRDELIDPLERIDRERMPYPVIAFANAGNKEILGTYMVGRNALGIKDQITLNTVHFETVGAKKVFRYGLWSLLEVVLHEQVHLYLNHRTEIDGKKRPAHGKEFVEKCLELGLHVRPVRGSHFQVADPDSPFGRIMKELGIEPPKDVPRSDPNRDYFRPPKERGKSTLNKWVCPDCNFSVRIGIKGDPELLHKPCGETLIRAEQGVIYEVK